MKKILYSMAVGVFMLMAAVACKKQPQWQLNATINGASEGDVVLLEAANPAGYWYALDSMSTDAGGSFTTSQPTGQYPDIFRINYKGKYIYFPIDSTEAHTLKTSADRFATDYELTGSNNAELITHIEKRLNDFLTTHNVADLDTAQTLKRELSGMVLGNSSSIVAFYIVNKQIDGHRLFRTDDRRDLRLIGAVANSFSEQRPNDPRTLYMKDLWLKNKGQFSTHRDTITADQISLIEIEALDEKGATQKLSDVAAKNKVVVLNFTNYGGDYSQGLNLSLREIYDAHHSAGLEIFQLGFSPDEFQWRMAAGNQPWVTVFNGTTDRNVANYNVGGLPAAFIIKDGELVERIENVEKLKSAVGKYIN